jgi:hypothetical protein
MGETIGAVVLTPQGPTHTGTGAQYNYSGPNYIIDPRSHRPVRAPRAPRPAVIDYLHWLDARFIPPDGYARAAQILQEGHAVVLTGRPGSGRRSTAQMLLHRLADAAGPLVQIPPDFARDRDEPIPELTAGDHVLLDLSSVSEELYVAGRELLESLYPAVCACSARLAAVVPEALEDVLDGELARLVISIDKPPGPVVLRRYLTVAGLGLPADLPLPALSDTPMRDIRKIADLVLGGQGSKQDTLQDSIMQAISAVSAPAGNLSSRVAELSGAERALLLSAALLTGARGDALHSAAHALHQVAGLVDEDTPVLERAGLSERLATLKNVVIDPDGYIRVFPLGYDAMVRTYFWTEHPDVRPVLCQWVRHVVEVPAMAAGDRDRLITRFAEQALRTDRPEDLIDLARCWTEPATPAQRWPDAVRVLQLGLEDQHHAGLFRRQIFTWAKDPQLSFERGQVLVEVCADVLARSYPMSALVRLRHLARQKDHRTSSAAREVLVQLAEQDVWFCRHLLTRLIASLEASERSRPVDVDLFLHIADPRRPASSLTKRQLWPLLRQGWHAAMTRGQQTSWKPAVHAWLASVEEERLSEESLTLLLDSAALRGDVLSSLYAIAVRASHDGEVSPALAERFCQRIDDLQCLD